MKTEKKKDTEKAKYEKPTLTKFKKLTDVVGGTPSSPTGGELGCTRF